ncbi:MAG TPA: helix-turn-helix transcriptional regulator [bacterium]|nr:helix-turn-helix transcriptional regulator [bacterium]
MDNYISFGDFFKSRRLTLGLSLRQFCLEHKLDPGNISRLERGLMPPPSSREILEKYASYLKIAKNSNDWYTFFDLAAASAGRIPDDVMKDEELVKKLPIIFRTFRGKQPTAAELDELAELVRRSG